MAISLNPVSAHMLKYELKIRYKSSKSFLNLSQSNL